MLTVSVARRNAASEVTSTSARRATVAIPLLLVLTVTIREKNWLLAVAAMVAPNVSASKRTSRLASTAPLASFSVTDAEATSPAQSVAAVIAALFSGAQIELAAGDLDHIPEAMVAGVTVATTADVAPSASVTVKVTGAAVSTFLGTMTNDAPAMVAAPAPACCR